MAVQLMLFALLKDLLLKIQPSWIVLLKMEEVLLTLKALLTLYPLKIVSLLTIKVAVAELYYLIVVLISRRILLLKIVISPAKQLLQEQILPEIAHVFTFANLPLMWF